MAVIYVCEECGEAHENPVDTCPDCGSTDITPEGSTCSGGNCSF